MKNISIGPIGLGRSIIGIILLAITILAPSIFGFHTIGAEASIYILMLPIIFLCLTIIIWGIILFRKNIPLVVGTIIITSILLYPLFPILL